MITPDQLVIPTLGPCIVKSPLKLSPSPGEGRGCFVSDSLRIRLPIEIEPGQPPAEQWMLEKAGPRGEIFFDPAQTRAAVVTCGGLCPGLNNVIRSLYLQLHHHYGIQEVLGVRYGFAGMLPDTPNPPLKLTTAFVENIHLQGGAVLGSSRGRVPPEAAVDCLERHNIQMLFCIGGDGAQRGAHRIALEISRRGARIAVVGIPKTIDNDIFLVWKSFGYSTAIERAGTPSSWWRKAPGRTWSRVTQASGTPPATSFTRTLACS